LSVELQGKRANIPTVATIILILAVAPSFFVTGRAQSGPSYSFNLLGPNTALNPATSGMFAGDTLVVTGSGSFVCGDSSCTSGTITGSGSYRLLAPAGTVLDRGTFVITTFVSFTPYGGPNPGHQGGQLVASGVGTSSITGMSAPITDGTVTCLLGSPPSGAMEGITSPPLFTTPVIGKTLFHLNN
jgi:hypothetical protein